MLAKYKIFLDKPGLHPFATLKIVYTYKEGLTPRPLRPPEIIYFCINPKGPEIMHI